MTCSPTWSTSDRRKTRQEMFQRRTIKTSMCSVHETGESCRQPLIVIDPPSPFLQKKIGEPSKLEPDVRRQGTNERPHIRGPVPCRDTKCLTTSWSDPETVE